MKRRVFLKRAAAVALCSTLLAIPPAAHHTPVPDYACHPKDIPKKALTDCYVMTRGTYAGWERPGVPTVV